MGGAFDEGFLFDELSEAKKDILNSIAKVYPKESKKFVKDECRKLAKVARKVAKREVGTAKGKKKNWVADKSYHKKFKVGKNYDYDGDTCCRAYNSSPHAHLIEYGHVNVPRGEKRATTRECRKKQVAQRKGTSFTMGKLVFDIATLQFEPEFRDDVEKFMVQYVDDTIKGKF